MIWPFGKTHDIPRQNLAPHIDKIRARLEAAKQSSGMRYSVRGNGVDLPERLLSEMSYDELMEYIHAHRKQGSFQETVFKSIREKGITPKQFYTWAGLDRKLFSAMKNGGPKYQPSQSTAIRCCFALKLPIDKAEELLKMAGYALSASKTTDVIIRYCIENGIWNLFDVNDLLDEFGEPPYFT